MRFVGRGEVSNRIPQSHVLHVSPRVRRILVEPGPQSFVVSAGALIGTHTGGPLSGSVLNGFVPS